MLNLRPIKTEAEHDEALAEISRLIALNAPEGSDEHDRLLVLGVLAADWEEREMPILPPDPIEAIKSRMDDLGLRPADLVEAMGGRNRVSEVLNRRRPLTLSMIRNLNRRLGLPVDLLVQEYPLTERPMERAK